MTDMPAFYPHELIEAVQKRLTKNANIHTLVLWTKHPAALLKDPLYSYLRQLKQQNIQLFVQLTISGLGKRIIGTDLYNQPIILEPNVPETNDAIGLLPDIISLLESNSRIKLRIDPIVRIKSIMGQSFSSLPYFEPIVKACVSAGIRHFTFSILDREAYKKVNNRLAKRGFEIIPMLEDERNRIQQFIKEIAQKYKVCIAACSVKTFPESSCIDATLLEKLHHQFLPASHKKKYSRPFCGCTASIDIGGWPPKKCFSGCLYCYANPQVM